LVLGLRPRAAAQAVLDGQQRGLRPVGDAELGQQMADVGLDRLLGDLELQGDALVGVAESDELQDLALASREVGDCVGGADQRAPGPTPLSVLSRRAATVGSMSASSAQALRTARASSAGSTSLSR
jgi:hypothetical protein